MNSTLRFAVFLIFVVVAAVPQAAELKVAKPTLAHLAALPHGENLRLAGFPTGPSSNAAMRFERTDVYAPDAHVYVVDANGQHEIPRSDHVFLHGYAEDGGARVALAFDRDGGFVSGSGSGPEGLFAVHASAVAGTHNFIARRLGANLPDGFKFKYQCGNEAEVMEAQASQNLAGQLRAATASTPALMTATTAHALRFATVAIDSDLLFMSNPNLFAGNTTAATNWIASMFNAMNSMYERDLLVHLYQGNTTLRTGGADPFATLTHLPADTFDLDVFSSYWKNNKASVTRTFALLLSGRESSSPFSCSASGIAWVDQYCQKGSAQGADTVGSYSINLVCGSINIDPDGAFNASLVGHELGHNFGAAHTHCTDKNTGAYLVATNTIDTCFNGEGATHKMNGKCYDGATSCPASGPGAPAGTIMSYCNLKSCGPDQENVLQFHPTQVTTLNAIIGAQGACLNETDDIFYSKFDW